MMLQGQTALVTGASRGIGRAIALELAAAGANVVVNYRSGREQADAVVRAITEQGGLACAHAADVSRRDQVKAMLDEVQATWPGSLSVVVNNAGVTADRTFRKMDDDRWRRVLEVNLNGAYNVIAEALPLLTARGQGCIVNVSSIIAQTGGFGQANYAASKAALLGLTKSLALELARSRITVNAVCPGFIDTDMVRAMPAEALEKVVAKVPMQRLGRPEDVARLVRFLATEGDYITGQQLNVNGGLYC
jgi:acetoacetyl-CoA reductase